MRVLFVVPCYFPATRFGGPIKSIHSLAKALASQGVEIHVFTTNSNGPDDLPVALDTPVNIDGVSVTYFQVERPRRYFRSRALREALHFHVREFDLIYAAWMYVYTTVVAGKEALAQGVPLVISPRGMLDRNAVAQKGRIRKLAHIHLVDSEGLNRAAAIHFTSEGERENSVFRVAPSRAIVVPNALEAEDFPAVDGAAELRRLGVPPGRPLVLFLGRLSYIKGLDLLADAWPIVLASVPAAHLILAGADDENLYESLHKRFERDGVSDSVSYVGMVRSAAKTALLQECALLVSPSYLESFGMSIAEAMSAGKPVVITDRVNISRDVATAKAGLVTSCEPSRIAAAIVELLSDQARSASMGEAGRALVTERYSLDGIASRMGTAFEAIAAHRPLLS